MFHLGLSTSQFLIHYMLTSCGSQSSTLSTVERVSLMRFQKCANVWVKRQVTRSWFNTMFIWQNQRSTFSTRAYEMPNYWRSWLWQQSQLLVQSCGTDLASIQNVIGYFYGICTTIVPVGVSCQGCHHSCYQGSQLGITDIHFFCSNIPHCT